MIVGVVHVGIQCNGYKCISSILDRKSYNLVQEKGMKYYRIPHLEKKSIKLDSEKYGKHGRK